MYERVPWQSFLNNEFRWRQGEHMVVISPTGQGKSTLLSKVLPARTYVVVFVTKAFDPTFEDHYRNYKVIRRWPPPKKVNRVLLWPKIGRTIDETLANQKRVFKEALDRIFLERGWCVVIDEEHWVSTMLGLSTQIAVYHHQARSSGISVVDGIQRPAFVPVITYSSATHAFIGKTTEKADLDRLSLLGGISKNELVASMNNLRRYEYVYVNTRLNHHPVITKVQL